ncbi:TadE/TadG family type IV pilus assembly protein [Nocardioides cavernaquae]|uniref:Pilus assembly protein n=1 Tax=Nocardioides cavernaquae TaxID=2321396 RepID=A0A3A5H9V9_9ACTN|nr:TadE/TadG family type IV pilus assembly protein [Nocardioides cavernaquae]RJS44830.1 pilus assembly protein [Nocardioides cavernaquae]
MRVRDRNQRGAAAVEFALIAPLFFVLVFGTIQFGWYMWTAEYTNSAARETARRVVVGDCWADYAAFSSKQGSRVTATTVSPNPATLKVGDPIVVTVTADADLNIDFFGFGLPTTVTRTYDARMEVDAQALAVDDSCKA